MDPTFSSHQPERHTDLQRELAGHPAAYESVNVRSSVGNGPDANAFHHYWRTLSRYKGTVCIGLLGGLLLAIAVSMVMPVEYRSRGAIQIQGVNTDFLNTKLVNPIEEGSTADSYLSELQTELQILESSDLQASVLDRLSSEGKAGPLEKETRGLLGNSAQVPIRYKELELIKKKLLVRQVGQTRLLEVMFTSKDPAFAALYLRELLKEYEEAGVAGRMRMNERTGRFLSDELAKARTKLEDSEKQLESYARTSGLLYATATIGGSTEKTNVAEEKLRELQESLSKSQADLALAQSRYEVARTAPPDTLAAVIDDESLKDMQTTINDLERQEAEASSIYTAKHERPKRLQAQIASLKNAFARKRGEILTSIQNNFQESQTRQRILQEAFSAQAKLVTDQAEKSIHYNSLKEQANADRQLFNNMLERVKQIGIASTVRANNVRLVDAPDVPIIPSSPNYLINLALGLFLGLCAGIAAVLIRDSSKSVLYDPGDAGYWSNLPELGVVPHIPLQGRRRNVPQLVGTAYSYSGNGLTHEKSSQMTLNPASATPSVSERNWANAADAFRDIATSIILSRNSGHPALVLTITSPRPAEGKTFVASNLAVALAQMGLSVLLVDGDLRNPGIHNLFSLDNALGLSSLLVARGEGDGQLFETIQQSGVNGLSVLTSGPLVFDPASLLYARDMRRLIQACRTRFEVVLIDTPPGLNIADTRIVSRLADYVVVVARSGRTSRLDLLTLQRRFEQDNTQVLGSVLNEWKSGKASQTYYSMGAGAVSASSSGSRTRG